MCLIKIFRKGGWRGEWIYFDFLIVNDAIYQKLSTPTHKKILPAQKFNVFQRDEYIYRTPFFDG